MNKTEESKNTNFRRIRRTRRHSNLRGHVAFVIRLVPAPVISLVITIIVITLVIVVVVFCYGRDGSFFVRWTVDTWDVGHMVCKWTGKVIYRSGIYSPVKLVTRNDA